MSIGASTGGVDALIAVLSQYPKDGPPAVIAQHMPKPFLENFTHPIGEIGGARRRADVGWHWNAE